MDINLYVMTQEDKELLLKDICARLLYNVKGIITYDESNTTFTVEGIDNNVLHLSDAEECYVEDFKPYLRPFSSMTDDERKYIKDKCGFSIMGPICGNFCLVMPVIAAEWLTDFYNSHYLDWRGLIEKGLAIEAHEGMYTNN